MKTNTANTTAAIISTSGEIIAITRNVEDFPSGKVAYAYNSKTDEISGNIVLVNPQLGKITRAKRYLESRAARECIASAKCISTETCFPRFVVSE